MNIQEALDKRIPRVRMAHWKNPNCYLRLSLLEDGTYGVWTELYDDISQPLLGLPVGSQCIPLWGFDIDKDRFEIYTGVISEHEQDESNYAKSYAET